MREHSVLSDLLLLLEVSGFLHHCEVWLCNFLYLAGAAMGIAALARIAL
ncbi:hypothetical protein NVV93_14940 [Pseudomonas sp. LS44]|nr:hypothetical protein [Pseudomonas sp. LS44]UVE16882.1 hypothetical protein NVV93_14940 [Pseudomonas sp. LS44]